MGPLTFSKLLLNRRFSIRYILVNVSGTLHHKHAFWLSDVVLHRFARLDIVQNVYNDVWFGAGSELVFGQPHEIPKPSENPREVLKLQRSLHKTYRFLERSAKPLVSRSDSAALSTNV